MHVAEAKRTLGSQIPWLCDTMDNELKHALGDRPNSEFVIGPDGKIVASRSWSSPAALRTDLENLVGAVDKPTRISDLNMKKLPPSQPPATGVVERVKLPGPMTPAIVKPLETSEIPHYVKLRAEMNGDQLYLGFFVDPLYKVHWNNQAPVLEYSIVSPTGITLTPDTGKAPKIDVDADTDPREFLVSLSGHSDDPLKLTVKYFACDDAESFCKPVTQQYEITLARDHDGGNRRSASQGRGRSGRPQGASGRGARPGTRPGGRGGGRGGGMRRQPPTNPPTRETFMAEMFDRRDVNQDGKLTRSELPPPMLARFKELDTNDDGALDRAELSKMRARGR